MDRVWYILSGIQYVVFWDLDGIDTNISSKGTKPYVAVTCRINDLD